MCKLPGAPLRKIDEANIDDDVDEVVLVANHTGTAARGMLTMDRRQLLDYFDTSSKPNPGASCDKVTTQFQGQPPSFDNTDPCFHGFYGVS